MANEIRLMNVCRSLNLDQTVVFVDPFDGTALDTADWESAPSWTIGGVASSGNVTVGDGVAKSSTANQLRVALLKDKLNSTSALRECSLDLRTQGRGLEWNILMDMDNTTPVPAASVRLRAARPDSDSLNRGLYLYVNEALIASSVTTFSSGSFNILRLTINAAGTMNCYWKSPTVPSISSGGSGYMPAGRRVGFSLQASTTNQCYAKSFNFNYLLAAVGGLPQRALCASANGLFYREDTNGDMVIVNDGGSDPLLASDRLLSSVNRLQKLYIADYGLADEGSDGITVGTDFDDAGAQNWTMLGIDIQDHRLEIFSGTAAQQGIYTITTVAAGSLTLGASPGNASGISYRIIRSPKVYDAQTDALTAVPIGTIGASPGQFPHGCTIVNAWLDRLLWSGDPRNQHAVFASKRGDPENYKYANQTAGEAFAYDPAQFAGASQIGDAVTAIIPYSDDYVMFAGQRSISIQRGDPTYGGELDLVTRDAGIVDKFAWCYLPDGRVIGLSTDGLYLFTPGPNMMPERVSRDRLPLELVDINPALFDTQLLYEIGRQGAKIFVTPVTAGPTTHWWFDWTKKGFWPEEWPDDLGPTASCVHSLGGAGTPVILLGGRDGYIRKEADDVLDDDGIAITSFGLLGPFSMGHPKNEGLIHDVLCEVAEGSGPVKVEVLVGATPQAALRAEVAHTFYFSPDTPNVTEWARARGGACFLRVSPAGANQWAIETLAFDKEVVGKLRA